MKKYKVTYERRVNTKDSYWDYASEIIEAHGLMHAQKLAFDHMRELKKRENLPFRIAKIIQVNDYAD